MNQLDLGRVVILIIIQASGCGLMFLLVINFRKMYEAAEESALAMRLFDSRFPIQLWGEFWFKQAMWFIVALVLIVVPITYY